MNHKKRDFAFQAKDVDERGRFTGYLSVFDEIDIYREVVAPGAFAKTLARWKSKDRYPPLLWQHRSYQPIGPFTLMREDSKGLYIEAKLLIDDVQLAREAHALLREKVIGGMSIGFSVPDGGDDYDSRAGILTLKEVDLWEGSLATFPANEAAQVDSVKAREQLIERFQSILHAGELPSIKFYEEVLHDVLGFTRSKAKALAGQGLPKLRREVEDQQATNAGESLDVRSVLNAVKSDSFETLLKERTS